MILSLQLDPLVVILFWMVSQVNALQSSIPVSKFGVINPDYFLDPSSVFLIHLSKNVKVTVRNSSQTSSHLPGNRLSSVYLEFL